MYSGSQAFQGNAGLCDHAPASVPHEDIGEVERTTRGRGPINSTSYAEHLLSALHDLSLVGVFCPSSVLPGAALCPGSSALFLVPASPTAFSLWALPTLFSPPAPVPGPLPCLGFLGALFSYLSSLVPTLWAWGTQSLSFLRLYGWILSQPGQFPRRDCGFAQGHKARK